MPKSSLKLKKKEIKKKYIKQSTRQRVLHGYTWDKNVLSATGQCRSSSEMTLRVHNIGLYHANITFIVVLYCKELMHVYIHMDIFFFNRSNIDFYQSLCFVI